MRPPLTSIAVTVSIHATLAGGDLTTKTEVEATDRVSIHATLAGGDGAGCRPCRHQSSFYPRHPRGWRHCGLPQYGRTGRISIHATPAGGDAPSTITAIEGGKFLSTPPPRVATPNSLAWVLARLFLSTPPPRVATTLSLYITRREVLFLSTPPPRVATQHGFCPPFLPGHFYPRHPRGWRQDKLLRLVGQADFYPRHPRGWRHKQGILLLHQNTFLSTPPPRVATAARCSATLSYAFLSTPPPRVATQGNPPDGSTAVISIHATPAGGDTAAM